MVIVFITGGNASNGQMGVGDYSLSPKLLMKETIPKQTGWANHGENREKMGAGQRKTASNHCFLYGDGHRSGNYGKIACDQSQNW